MHEATTRDARGEATQSTQYPNIRREGDNEMRRDAAKRGNDARGGTTKAEATTWIDCRGPNNDDNLPKGIDFATGLDLSKGIELAIQSVHD